MGETKKNTIDTARFLNIDIMCLTQKQLLDQLHNGVLLTPNVDHLVRLQHDKEYYDCYKKAEWVICDSRILHGLSRFTNKAIPEAIPGSSFFTQYYLYHKDDPSCNIFLLGAAEGVAQKAMNEINSKIGRNIIVGAHSPSFGFEKKEDECEEIVDIINQSGANVLLVGVGDPKQTKWIMKYRDRLPKIDLFMALGATIDFEAKNLKRAPKVWQKLRMEWFYRFLKEPRRLFKRYFRDDMKFFWYFGKQLLGIYRDPFAKSN